MSDPFDRALRAAARRGRAAGDCPDAAVLASYVDDALPAEERREIEAHTADCTRCLEHLALLGAVSVERESQAPARPWLARWGWLIPVATAVLLVAVWVRLPEERAKETTPAVAVPSAADDRAKDAGSADALSALPESAAANQASRAAAKVTPAARPTTPAERKLNEVAQQRRDQSRQKAAAPERDAQVPSELRAAAAPPVTAPAAATATPAPAPTAPPPPSAPALSDAIKEEVRVTGASARREADLQKSARQLTPLVVTASPTEFYRAAGQTIEVSADGGASWRVLASVGHVTITTAACAPDGPCWFGDSQGTMLRRTPTGLVTSVLPVRAAVRAIVAEKPLGAVVTVEGGQRFRTTDGGTTWLPVP